MNENDNEHLGDSVGQTGRAIADSAANAVQGAVKAGQAAANVAKGAAMGGPYGALLSLAWQMRHVLFWILILLFSILYIAVIMLLSLPGLIANSLFGANGVEPAEDATPLSSYTEYAEEISGIIDQAYEDALDRVESQIDDYILAQYGTLDSEDAQLAREMSVAAIVDNAQSSISYDITYVLAVYSATLNVQDATEDDMVAKLEAVAADMFTVEMTAELEEEVVDHYEPVTWTTYTQQTIWVVDTITYTGSNGENITVSAASYTGDGSNVVRYKMVQKTYYVADGEQESDNPVTIPVYSAASVVLPEFYDDATAEAALSGKDTYTSYTNLTNRNIVSGTETDSSTYYVLTSDTQTLTPEAIMKTINYVEYTVNPFDETQILTAFGLDDLDATYIEQNAKTGTTDDNGHTWGETVIENIDEETGWHDNVVYCTECGEELSRETVTTMTYAEFIAYQQECLELTLWGDAVTSSSAALSDEVESYTWYITKAARLNGIEGYVDLIKAVMMQESGGRGDNPMQYNGCTDPYDSIDKGVAYLAQCLTMAGVSSPTDLDNISLALQGYNYGTGYITWALNNYGGYTTENAKEFSALKKAELGWDGYGDTAYVSHVLRYYPYGQAGSYIWPLSGYYDLSSLYGSRIHPITGEADNHGGIDIPAPAGTGIQAAMDGVVVTSEYNSSYGNYVMIKHIVNVGGADITTYTLYAHMSSRKVSVGDVVTQGQIIGLVGSTGSSTGNHLHFEVRIGGDSTAYRSDPIDLYPDLTLYIDGVLLEH